MNNLEFIGCQIYKKGSGIHIKKKNRGKFTASAKKVGRSVQEHARAVLKNPKTTPLQKKRANFARNAAKWKHEEGSKIHKPDGHRSILDNGWITIKRLKKGTYGLIKKHEDGGEVTSPNYKVIVNTKWGTDKNGIDKNWKYSFLDKNRKQLNGVLSNVAHKRGLLNVLLNEGYATNMLNSKLTVDPDSVVIARNPTKNPGNTSYKKLGNFGLDNLDDVKQRLNITGLTYKKPFDNKMKVWGKDNLSLNDAAEIINMKLNDAKKLLIEKYGNSVHAFFKNNPGSEDRMLYAYYKMPNKFKSRLNSSKSIQDMYNIYINGGLNDAFQQVDNYSDVINQYFKR